MPEEVKGKLEVQTSNGLANTITLDGDKGTISSGGDVTVYDNAGKEKVRLGAESSSAISAKDDIGKIFLDISDFGSPPTGGLCGLQLGVEKASGGNKAGFVELRDKAGNASIYLDGTNSKLSLGADDKPGTMVLRDAAGNDSIALDGDRGKISMGLINLEKGPGQITAGSISIHGDTPTGVLTLSPHSLAIHDVAFTTKMSLSLSSSGSRLMLANNAGESIVLDGTTGHIVMRGATLRDVDGKTRISFDTGGNDSLIYLYDDAGNRAVTVDGGLRMLTILDKTGKPSITVDGGLRKLVMRNDFGNDSITLDGYMGDINLRNSDCAEEFEISDPIEPEPGTVMVINEYGKLDTSDKGYDNKVAGVISGGGDNKPGIVLGKGISHNSRVSVALIGKVFCKVDADYSPIEVGDMLTTSPTPGHAMKATDPFKSFGAVIGKALGLLKQGKGLIPILVAMQ